MQTSRSNANKKIYKKKFFSFAIKLSLTLVILYLIVSSVSYSEYKRVIELLSVKSLLEILLLIFFQVLFLAARWNLLAKAAGSRLVYKTSVFGILMSFFFSQGLPASVGGDAFRVWWHKKEGIATGRALQIIIFDRIYGVLSLLILCIFSVYLLMNKLGNNHVTITILTLEIILAILLGISILPWDFGVTRKIEHFSLNFPKHLKKFVLWIVSSRGHLKRQPLTTTLFLLVFGALTHLLVVFQIYIIGSILEPNKISVLLCLMAVPPALLVSYMPFSIAGWGVREASLVVTFGALGIKASVAIVISVILGLGVLMISCIGGFIWIVNGYRDLYIKTPLVLGENY